MLRFDLYWIHFIFVKFNSRIVRIITEINYINIEKDKKTMIASIMN